MPGTCPAATPGQGGDAPAPFACVAIVGFGLIGGSLGLAVKARWPDARVIAVDRAPVVDAALRMGAADAGGEDVAMAAGADLVVLAAPIGVNLRTLEGLAAKMPGEALVTDVGSTKRATVAAAAALPARLRFVGGHPLAGAAVSGLGAARADLFERRPWFLTPAADGCDVARLSAWVRALGATVHQTTPEAHDALVAMLSHLPQLAASALMHVVGERVGADGLALGGPGLRDSTRLASSRAEIWSDIVRTNQDNVAEAIDALVAALLEMKADLDWSRGALDRTFDSAAAWKATLERSFAER